MQTSNFNMDMTSICQVVMGSIKSLYNTLQCRTRQLPDLISKLWINPLPSSNSHLADCNISLFFFTKFLQTKQGACAKESQCKKTIFTLIYPVLSTSTAAEARLSGRVFDVRNESHCNLGQKESDIGGRQITRGESLNQLNKI